MLISDFDYELPDDLIAQNPLEKRDKSRMLVVNRKRQTIKDGTFSDFPEHLGSDDLLVLNNTRVFPARLFGKSESGAKIELFLIEEIGDRFWLALARPGRRLKPGKRIVFSAGLSAEVFEKQNDGRILVRFHTSGDFYQTLDEIGKTPLPPYIKREAEEIGDDRERYQTIYAKERGAIAAPTAGLHFTSELIEDLEKARIDMPEITLHVGYGTFEPVRVSELSDHEVMPERFEISETAARKLNDARKTGRRIIAVGTTTTRALESCFSKNQRFVSGKQTADLTITPGYEFCAIDGLLTNFHLPKSSLLVLVSTFGGYELIMNAYQHAVRERYRFYSYGDCMFIS